MSSKKDKHIIMDLIIKTLHIMLNKPITLRIDWCRGNKFFIILCLGAKKVST